MKNLSHLKTLLPSFPRTPHLPYNPNKETDDLVATNFEAGPVFTQLVNIEEKIDGASVGMMLYEDNPLIRNRDHILNKAYVKDTAAKKQFASIWNWFYKNKEKFEELQELGSYAVYGEWCIAQHSIYYNKLPDWFIAYDIYDYEKDCFVSPVIARNILSNLGFCLPELLLQGKFDEGYDELTLLANGNSLFSDEKREGIYLKVYDANSVLNRFKMIRNDFERGKYWNPNSLSKNKLL